MSGVKVTNERPARAIPAVESVAGDVDDEDVDWEPDATTGIPPGGGPGDVLTWDGDSWEPEPPAASGDFELNIEGGQSVIEAHGSMGATETFDPTDGNVHTGTLTANCTFTLNAPTGSGACTLELRLLQDGTGGWTITWPGSVTVSGTLVTTAGTSSIVILETLDGGTSWIAVVVGAGEPTADAHIADTSDAHDASAVSVLDTAGNFTGTDVEAVLAELASDVGSAGAVTHVHVAYETHTSDGSTTTFTLDQVYEPGSVMAWNRTAGTMFGVTEVLPDQATLTAAGSAADLIDFMYAASVI